MLGDKYSIKPGDTFLLERTFTAEDVSTFTKISGDEGVHHVAPDAKGRIMLQGLLTATLATQFGGSIDYLASEMTFRFHRPVFAGDTIRCDGVCDYAADEPGRRLYHFSFSMKNQNGKEVLSGDVKGVVLRSIAALLLSAAVAQGRLVVLVVVDQLRYQDLLWLSPEFGAKGFAGLGRPSPMRYDTVVTETAADHAVLSTGAYADMNGIIGNHWWEGGHEREAVDDAACPVWGGGKGRSAGALRVPTVGDALKLGTNGQGRSVSVAVKDRTALFLGGPSADVALWYDSETGQLTSSTCFAPTAPQWVPRDVSAPYRDWTWTMGRPDVIARLLPEARAAGAAPKWGIGAEFPHRVGQGALDKRLYEAIRNSPASTTIALQAARAAVKELKLGESGTDVLAVGLPVVDGVGHEFGTLARERVDAILRMHDELSAFLDELRARFGPRLSIVLTADHGLTPTLADLKRLRVPQGGTESIDELVPKVEKALADALGPRGEPWVAAIDGSVLFLRPPFPPRAVELAAEVLRQEPGFWRVIPAGEIDRAEPAERHAWFPGRSGQVLLVPRPLWTVKKHSDAADHGSPWNDDALVPLLIKAPGFRLRGEAVFRATQVAPSLAALLDISPPSAALDLPAIEHE